MAGDDFIRSADNLRGGRLGGRHLVAFRRHDPRVRAVGEWNV